MAASLPRKQYSPAVLALAGECGIDRDELPLIINGCSGGLSRAYSLAGRQISCENCCDLHDLRYQLGGTAAERKAADVELRECAAGAGSYPSGWKGRARKAWRRCRAWIMYAAVRLCGRWYWG